MHYIKSSAAPLVDPSQPHYTAGITEAQRGERVLSFPSVARFHWLPQLCSLREVLLTLQLFLTYLCNFLSPSQFNLPFERPMFIS